MPRKITHAIIGGGVGTLCYLGYCWFAKNKPSVQGLGTAFGLGGLGGSIPDIIEPASNPNHRKFFHSAGFSTFLASFLKVITDDDEIAHDKKLAFIILILSYLSHILSDSTTPRGIPLF